MINLAVNQQQSADLRQEQSLTKQQIQAVEILAAPLTELQTCINEELQSNPLLEVDSARSETPEPGETEEASTTESGDDDEWVNQLIELDQPAYQAMRSFSSAAADEQERREHFMNSIPDEQSWEDSLREQLRFLGLAPDLLECCEMIVVALDEEGYLNTHPADLAMALGQSLDTIQHAIRTVQSCEPAGIAARDLRERLMLQLSRRNQEETLAYRLVDKHLDDLAANRIPTLTKKLGVAKDRIRDALQCIKELKPHVVEERRHPHELEVQADVDVEENGDGFEIRMQKQGIPGLRISARYRQLLMSSSTTAETREYIKEKIRSAAFLINCIDRRQSTLERIVHSIVSAQEDFFREGIAHMRPLTMDQVADEIGVHETTVSRGVAGKYLRCKYGLIPLRQFFSNGYRDDDGNQVSSLAAKNAVRRLIDDEDPRQPLSDSRISKMLQERGLKVARRTVAKYRDTMGLLPAKLRRQYW